MRGLNLNKTVYSILMLAIGGVLIMGMNGCKKDTTTGSGSGSGAGGGGTASPDYFKLNGTTVNFISPTIGVQTGNVQGEELLEWKSYNRGDTVASILAAAPRKEGTIDPSSYIITLKINGLTVKINGGDFKYEKLDGKWVSTLKNGIGEENTGVGSIKKYPGVELKMTWPN